MTQQGNTPPVVVRQSDRVTALAIGIFCKPYSKTAVLAGGFDDDRYMQIIARHAEAARMEERERCAAIAETRHTSWRMPHPDDANPGEVCCDVTACADIAARIRSTAQ